MEFVYFAHGGHWRQKSERGKLNSEGLLFKRIC